MAVIITIKELEVRRIHRPDTDEDDNYSHDYDYYHADLMSSIAKAGGTIEEKESLPWLDRWLFRRTTTYGRTFAGVDSITDITATIASLGGAAATLKIIRDILVAWINKRATRSVTIKVGHTTIKIKGQNDIDSALRVIESLDREREKESRNRSRTSG